MRAVAPYGLPTVLAPALAPARAARKCVSRRFVWRRTLKESDFWIFFGGSCSTVVRSSFSLEKAMGRIYKKSVMNGDEGN